MPANQLVSPKKSPDDKSSFVDTFLAYGAGGFIGTLARIDIRTASAIAEQILLSAVQPGGVQVAEQLRLLRKAAIEQMKQKALAQQADYYHVIDTFMYVYYGNPLARLQLQRKGLVK